MTAPPLDVERTRQLLAALSIDEFVRGTYPDADIERLSILATQLPELFDAQKDAARWREMRRVLVAESEGEDDDETVDAAIDARRAARETVKP